MAISSRSLSISRNYGSAQLNLTAFDFNIPNAQAHTCMRTQWQQPYCRSTTPCSETSEDHDGDTEAGLELHCTRSNSSSASTSSRAVCTGEPCASQGPASLPRTKGEQDAYIEGVIEKLSAYSLTAAREERRMEKKLVPPRTPVSGEDAALWMRVWGSAHAVREARTRRRLKNVTRAKPI